VPQTCSISRIFALTSSLSSLIDTSSITTTSECNMRGKACEFYRDTRIASQDFELYFSRTSSVQHNWEISVCSSVISWSVTGTRIFDDAYIFQSSQSHWNPYCKSRGGRGKGNFYRFKGTASRAFWHLSTDKALSVNDYRYYNFIRLQPRWHFREYKEPVSQENCIWQLVVHDNCGSHFAPRDIIFVTLSTSYTFHSLDGPP